MQADNGIARKLDTVFEAPEPFSGALLDHFRSPWLVSLIIYAPATVTGVESAPGPHRVMALIPEAERAAEIFGRCCQ
jgi:hypothetical protein